MINFEFLVLFLNKFTELSDVQEDSLFAVGI
jgi:hypothetical protein